MHYDLLPGRIIILTLLWPGSFTIFYCKRKTTVSIEKGVKLPGGVRRKE